MIMEADDYDEATPDENGYFSLDEDDEFYGDPPYKELVQMWDGETDTVYVGYFNIRNEAQIMNVAPEVAAEIEITHWRLIDDELFDDEDEQEDEAEIGR